MPGEFGSTGGTTGFAGGDFVTQLLQMLQGLSQGTGSQYLSFLQNPTASPLYQNQLSGLLRSLEPGEKQATTNLMDMFRGAGNMASGAYGTAASNLQGNLQRNRQVMASQLLGQMFPQMTSALLAPVSAAGGLVGSLRNPQGQNPQAGLSPSQGLQTPMQSDQSSSNPYAALLSALQSVQPYETAWSGLQGGFNQYGMQTTPPVV